MDVARRDRARGALAIQRRHRATSHSCLEPTAFGGDRDRAGWPAVVRNVARSRRRTAAAHAAAVVRGLVSRNAGTHPVNGESELNRLCAAAGIERVYHDQFGTRREVSGDTARAIAAVLGTSDVQPQPPPLLQPMTIRYEDESEISIALEMPA